MCAWLATSQAAPGCPGLTWLPACLRCVRLGSILLAMQLPPSLLLLQPGAGRSGEPDPAAGGTGGARYQLNGMGWWLCAAGVVVHCGPSCCKMRLHCLPYIPCGPCPADRSQAQGGGSSAQGGSRPSGSSSGRRLFAARPSSGTRGGWADVCPQGAEVARGLGFPELNGGYLASETHIILSFNLLRPKLANQPVPLDCLQVQEFKNQEEPGVPPLFDEEAQPKAPEKGGPVLQCGMALPKLRLDSLPCQQPSSACCAGCAAHLNRCPAALLGLFCLCRRHPAAHLTSCSPDLFPLPDPCWPCRRHCAGAECTRACGGCCRSAAGQVSETHVQHCLWMGALYQAAVFGLGSGMQHHLGSHTQLPLCQCHCRAAKALEGALAEIKMDQFPRCPTRAVCGAYIALQAS